MSLLAELRFAHVLIVCGLALSPGLARAEATDPNAKQLFLAGRQAYDAGRYDVAIKAFESAQALAPADLLLFDLAQCHRQKFLAEADPASLDKAIELYRRFVASPATGPQRAAAGAAIAELLLLRAKRPDDRGSPPNAAPVDHPATKTELMVVTEAMQALVSLDDKPPTPAPLLEMVAPGVHRARVTAPGFVPAEAEVTAIAERFVVREIRLEPRPALLELAGRQGTAVQIDGRPAATLPAGPLELTPGRHHLVARLRGYQAWEREVDLERGEHVQMRSELRPTTRRRAVRWTGLAASALGAGAIAGGTIWGTQQQIASDIYNRYDRGAGHLTVADAVEYERARSSSNQARVATSVCIAVGGALAITTLTLYLVE